MILNAYAEGKEVASGVTLKSCGHIFAKPGRCIDRPKGRADWLLFYVAKGSETFLLQGREVTGEAGSFLLFRPYEKQYHINTSAQTAEFYYAHFTADASFDAFALESSRLYTTPPSAKIADAFEEMLAEMQTKAPHYELLCISLLIGIFARLARRTQNDRAQYREDFHKIAFVTQSMHRAYAENLSLEEYARMCNTSKFHFLRMFERVTGETPLAYRTKIRMEHAKEMLEEGILSVGDIGRQLGYDSPSRFCDAFKKETGCSPLSYRRRMKT